MSEKFKGKFYLNDKLGNQNRPDFKGKIFLENNKVLQVALWKQQTQDGKTYLSASAEYKD